MARRGASTRSTVHAHVVRDNFRYGALNTNERATARGIRVVVLPLRASRWSKGDTIDAVLKQAL